MTSYLIDTNVWLAMTWDRHPHHLAASRWFESADVAAFLFCRLTMLGFLRLLTNAKVMGGSTATLSEALALYDQWRQDPRVELLFEPRGIEDQFRQAAAPFLPQSAPKAVADCYLVGIAATSSAQLVTLDCGLANSARRCKVPVTLLPAA